MLMGRGKLGYGGQVWHLGGRDTWAKTWKTRRTQPCKDLVQNILLIAEKTASAQTLWPEPACDREQEIKQSKMERVGDEATKRGRARCCQALLARIRCSDFILITIKSHGRILSRVWHDKPILLPATATITIYSICPVI